jgi:hypothetical protein
MKFIRALIGSIIIWVVAFTSIALYPFFFLLWGMFNRKYISAWLSMPVALMSSVLYFQLYTYFREIKSTANLMDNPAILYGICLIPFFLLTRISSLRKTPLTTKSKYILSIVLFLLLLISSLVIIVAVHVLAFKIHRNTYLYISEITLVFWASLVIYLFFRYPEDALIKYVQRYGLLLFQWVQGNKPGSKI